MLHLQIAEEAEQDILDLHVRNPYAAKRLAILFDQLRGDEQLREHLLEDCYGEAGDAPFSIRKWQAQWRVDRNLWRLKDFMLLDLDADYRVIYAYLIGSRCLYILAVAPRSFDYDEDSEIGRRILATYSRLRDED